MFAKQSKEQKSLGVYLRLVKRRHIMTGALMDESLMLLSSGSRKTPVLPQLISDCSLVEGLLMEKWRES